MQETLKSSVEDLAVKFMIMSLLAGYEEKLSYNKVCYTN